MMMIAFLISSCVQHVNIAKNAAGRKLRATERETERHERRNDLDNRFRERGEKERMRIRNFIGHRGRRHLFH